MITVATVCRSGSFYSPEIYVDRLYRQVRRWMPPVPWKFRCLTDTPMPWLFEYGGRLKGRKGWDGYDTIPLLHDWPGWWSKLELFRPGLFDGLVLYLDLDTLIVGPLDPLIGYGGRFAALSDFYSPTLAESGVMLFQGGDLGRIYRHALRDPAPLDHTGEARFWRQYEDPERLQDLFPGMFGSYNADELATGPGDFSVVSFHGHPKQHNLPGSWVEDAWTKDFRPTQGETP